MTKPEPLHTSSVVECSGLDLAYGTKTVLRHVTGSVEPGQALALVGPNGSGKTTLMRALLGQVNRVAGTLTVLGKTPGKAPKGSLGYVPQVANLDDTFPVKVLDVVLMGLYSQLGLWRRPGKKERQVALQALSQVGLEKRAHDQFGQLSGGQKQRVLVARCIASQPKLIMLDEPFNGLDQPNREALIEIIAELKVRGVALVISTHDLVLAREVCDQVALLAGRQIAFGPTDEVLTPELIAEAYGGTPTGFNPETGGEASEKTSEIDSNAGVESEPSTELVQAGRR